MAGEPTTSQSDGTTAVRRTGFGIGNAIIALGVLALIAVIGFIVTSANQDRALRTAAVTSAASALAADPPPSTPSR